jgi:hypothetical protein
MQGFWNKFKGCTLVGQYIMDRQDKKMCSLLKELNEVVFIMKRLSSSLFKGRPFKQIELAPLST